MYGNIKWTKEQWREYYRKYNRLTTLSRKLKGYAFSGIRSYKKWLIDEIADENTHPGDREMWQEMLAEWNKMGKIQRIELLIDFNENML